MVNIIEYNKELQAKVNVLRRQLAELETEDGLRESPWKICRLSWGPVQVSVRLPLFALQFMYMVALTLAVGVGSLYRSGLLSTSRWKSLTHRYAC